MAAFHFAFFVRDLTSTRRFYGDVLGCREGRSTDTWVDFDFFGNQISAHTTGSVTPTQNTGKVEDILVPMPHFGAILDWRGLRGGGRPGPRGRRALRPGAQNPLRRAAGGAGHDVPPRPQRQRARIQELPSSGARLHGMSGASVAVIGGGVIGASVAYHLARRGWRDVVVLDRGPAPGGGSTGRATGGFRAQYATAVNVRLSLLAREKLRCFEAETGVDPGYAECGYLWLAESSPGARRARAGAAHPARGGAHRSRPARPRRHRVGESRRSGVGRRGRGLLPERRLHQAPRDSRGIPARREPPRRRRSGGASRRSGFAAGRTVPSPRSRPTRARSRWRRWSMRPARGRRRWPRGPEFSFRSCRSAGRPPQPRRATCSPPRCR